MPGSPFPLPLSKPIYKLCTFSILEAALLCFGDKSCSVLPETGWATVLRPLWPFKSATSLYHLTMTTVILHNTIHKVSACNNKHLFTHEPGSTECWSIQLGLGWAALWVSWGQLIQLAWLGHLESFPCNSFSSRTRTLAWVLLSCDDSRSTKNKQKNASPLEASDQNKYTISCTSFFWPKQVTWPNLSLLISEVYTFHQVTGREHLWTIIHREDLFPS